MNQKKELLKNTLIISIGKFSTKIVSFLLLPLYTAILIPSETGQVDLLNKISIFLIPIITLQMDEAMFRFLIDAKNDQDKTSVFSRTVTFSLFSTIIWSIIIFIVGNLLHYEYTLWLIFYCFASVIFTLASSFARGEGNFKLYTLIAFLDSLLRILLNILFIAVMRVGLTGMFLSYIISATLIGLFGLFKLRAHRYIKLGVKSNKNLMEMVKYALPLVPTTISFALISLTDTLMITNYLGSSYNGIYSTSNNFPMIINTCYGFFNTSWRESASKVVNNTDRDEFYSSVYLNLKRFLMGVSIVVISALPFVFNILINAKYNESYLYIPFMIIGVYFANMASFSSGIFSAYKDTKILAPTTIVATIINITFNFLFIKKIGLYATVFSTMIAYFTITMYRDYKLKKYIELPKDKFLPYTIFVLGILFVLYYNNNILLHVLGLIIGFSYAYYINRNFIKSIFNKNILKKLVKRRA